MNKQKKKMPKWLIIPLCIISSFILTWSTMAVLAITVEYFTPDEMEYRVNSDGETCTVVRAKDPETVFLRVPKEIDGYTVTVIEKNAFKQNKCFIAIIPKTIEKIGSGAFSECDLLVWVSGIKKCTSLTKIEESTFEKCTFLSFIKLPESVEVIDKYAFIECQLLKNIKLPSNLNTIGQGAFVTCIRIKRIDIPASVENIEGRVFEGDFALKNINVDTANPNWCSNNGVLYSKDMSILHTYPAGKEEKCFAIPEGVTTISGYAFAYSTNLETLEIPSSVVAIGEGVFAYVDSHGAQFHTINYDGTVEMWQSIVKSEYWAAQSPNFTIYCTDGQISKYGKVTYK